MEESNGNKKNENPSKVIALLTAFIMVLSVFAAVPPVEAFANGTLCYVKSHNMYLSAKKTATDTLTRHSYDKYTSYKMKITGTSR